MIMTMQKAWGLRNQSKLYKLGSNDTSARYEEGEGKNEVLVIGKI